MYFSIVASLIRISVYSWTYIPSVASEHYNDTFNHRYYTSRNGMESPLISHLFLTHSSLFRKCKFKPHLSARMGFRGQFYCCAYMYMSDRKTWKEYLGAATWIGCTISGVRTRVCPVDRVYTYIYYK